MLQPDVYKIVHVAGILLVFMSLGGLSLHAINGGTRETNAARRLVGITYGAGLLLILLGGFGWLGATGVMGEGIPGWTWVKIGIWLLIGGLLALPGRRPEAGRWVWIVAPLLGVAGAWLAGTKPF
jgi:hypothetical protein